MQSQYREAILKSLLHALAWVLAYVLVIYVFDYSPSKQAYGLLSGWWCALYVGYIFNIQFRTTIVARIAYVLVGLLTASLAAPWVSHDWSSVPAADKILYDAVHSVVILSPIAINTIIILLKKRCAHASTAAR